MSSTLLCGLVAQCAGAPLLKGHPTVYGARYVKSLGGSTPEIVAFEPPGFLADVKVIAKAGPGDFLNGATFSGVLGGTYYTLIQPVGVDGIHLGAFDIATGKLVVHPLPVTVASGGVYEDTLIGIDETDIGLYFVILNPKTGLNTSAPVPFGREYDMDSGDCTAIDAAAGIFYAILPHGHGGNEFHLAALDAATGANETEFVVLDPTPDLTPPQGLVSVGEGKLLAFVPTDDPATPGGWKLVTIDAASGKVRDVNCSGLGPIALRLRVSGVSFIIPSAAGKPGSGTLYAALAENIGLPLTLYGFDVGCALAGDKDVDCVTSKTPWQTPHPALASAPEDLAVG